MNIWENTVLTDQGKALQAKLMKGQTLKIIRVTTGTKKVPVVDLRQQVSVTEGGYDITLQPPRTEGDSTVLPVLLENKGLENSYELWQVGFYADDPDEGEILFCLAQAAQAKNIPSQMESPGFSISWDFYFKTSNVTPFEVLLDSKGLVNIEQYQIQTNIVNEVKSKVDSLNLKLDEKADKSSLNATNVKLNQKADQTSLNAINTNLNMLSSQVNNVKGMRMAAGEGTISSVGQAYKVQRVNYGVTFRSNPVIVVGLNQSGANRFVCVGTHDPSGFNVNAYCTQGTADVKFTWIAIGFV